MGHCRMQAFAEDQMEENRTGKLTLVHRCEREGRGKRSPVGRVVFSYGRRCVTRIPTLRSPRRKRMRHTSDGKEGNGTARPRRIRGLTSGV